MLQGESGFSVPNLELKPSAIAKLPLAAVGVSESAGAAGLVVDDDGEFVTADEILEL